MSGEKDYILIDLGYHLGPIAISTLWAKEVLFLREDQIYPIPRSQSPFIGIALVQNKTITLLDLKGLIFKSYDQEYKEEYENKFPFIIIEIKNTLIGLRINNIFGYYSLEEKIEDANGILENIIHPKYVQSVFNDKILDIEEETPILDINLAEIFNQISEDDGEIESEEDDFDLSQFTLPDEEMG